MNERIFNEIAQRIGNCRSVTGDYDRIIGAECLCRQWRDCGGQSHAEGEADEIDRAGKRRGWADGLHAIHRKLLAKEWEPTSDGVNFAAIVCEVDKHLAPDATVTTDAGNFGSFVHRYIGFRQGQIFLSSVVGAMGSGMPMAVAAALRRSGTQPQSARLSVSSQLPRQRLESRRACARLLA